MTEPTLSAGEVYEQWSAEKLKLFRGMSRREQVAAFQSGALEHWTPATRNTAIELLGGTGAAVEPPLPPETVAFEAAKFPLPPVFLRKEGLDRLTISAAVGWTLIVGAVAAHSIKLF